MSDSVKIGDVVKLKSGGPEMIVVDVDKPSTRDACAWFHRNERHHLAMYGQSSSKTTAEWADYRTLLVKQDALEKTK